MSHAPKTTLRMAAVFTGFALSAGIAVPAFAAAPSVARAAAPSVFLVAADPAPAQVVSRLSVATGAQEGGNKILVSGTGLATVDGTDPTKFVAETVKFGTIDPKTKAFTPLSTVADADVTALSTGALEVKVPAATAATGTTAAQLKVVVVVGDAKVGPAYTYVQAAPSTKVLSDTGYSSDTGSTGSTVTGEGFEVTATGNQVVVGGKPAKVTKVEVAGSGDDKLTFSAPAGLVGVQDVVVTTKAGSAYAGYVTFEATTPTFSTDVKSGLTTQPTTVAVTGANLGLVKTASFQFTTGGKTVNVPVAVTPVKDKAGALTGLKLVVPKWDAKYIAFADGDKGIEGHIVLGTGVVSTTGGADDKFEWKIPVQSTVTDADQVADVKVATSTKYTLTGTDLTGLVNVVLTPQADSKFGKTVTVPATAVTVVDGTSASFILPTLPAGKYDVVVKTQAAKNSDTYVLTSAGLPTTLTKASYAEAVTGSKPVDATVSLTGTNFTGNLKARVYAVGADDAAKDAATATAVKATSLTAGTFTLAGNLGAGDYTVELSTDGGTTWTGPTATVKLVQTLTKVGYTSTTGVVTLTGTGLTKATVARLYKSDTEPADLADIKGTAITTTAATAGSFTATKDLGAGEYSVQVSLDGKTWSTATKITLIAPLKLTSAAYADKKVTLTGDSLNTATTVKLFKGTFASSTQVTGTYAPATGIFTVPTALAAGEYFVSVQAGTGATLTTTFTVA
ncbi:IPT/TIG domain-containing protein [Kineococcus rubinsiae]|uniref:IPT/TIG domain-containing protein n=1 Tax=Kineococcus rubinsiae TaxID=2609562 RepID=UPI00142FD7B7|nr:IPT/TIG domain-containing protein [Kineococcus rubinsiae]NIZ92060.1 hypothetical protein [Kineococcus rubinsiae]